MQYALDHLRRVTLSVHVRFIRVLVRRAGQVNEVPVLMPLSRRQYCLTYDFQQSQFAFPLVQGNSGTPNMDVAYNPVTIYFINDVL